MPTAPSVPLKQQPRQMAGKTPFISCSRCRSRKIKCTGERPTCSNCSKREFECHYDLFVKRRGPDKEPGGRLKPRGIAHPVVMGPHLNTKVPNASTGLSTRATSIQLNPAPGGSRNVSLNTPSAPTPLEQAKKDWWSELLSAVTRETVMALCKAFLDDRHIWFNFFHKGLFFSSLLIQELAPHVVAAVMAHMTFLTERTRSGQLRSLQYAEDARKMLDYFLAAGDTNPSLAQTAVLLAALEFQPHIHQNLARATAALGYIETCAKTCFRTWTTSSTIRREEMRRMCWALSHLAANVTIWRHLTDRPVLGLSSANPERFEQLFPQVFAPVNDQVSRWSSWPLYCRSIRIWHAAVNNAGGTDRAAVIGEARELLSTITESPSAGAHDYIWQAREWTIAARGHLGDFDDLGAREWFKAQKAALASFAKGPQSDQGPMKPTYCWWYLMVAYTALRFSEHDRSLLPEADQVLRYVYCALDDISQTWPCSTLEFQCNALRNKHAAQKT